MKLLLERWRLFSENEERSSLKEFVAYLKEKYALSDLNLYLRESKPGHPKTALHLSNIRLSSDSRGQGTGTKAMGEVIEYADKSGLPITLIPIPENDDVERLRSWYERFGFEDWYREDEYGEEDEEREYTKYMIRFPEGQM